MNIVKLTKKFIIIIIMLCILIGASNSVYGATITLNQVVDKFNSSNPMAEHLKDTYGSNVNASLEKNKIILTHNNCPFTDSKIQKIEFKIENNILSTEISKSTKSTTAYMSELSMAWMLIDCVGQLNGYKKEQFYDTLKGTGKNYKDYTLSKEGLEVKTFNNTTNVKIDLSRKIPIINTKFETNNDIPENTEDIKTIIVENEIEKNTNNEKQNNETLNGNSKADNNIKSSETLQTGNLNNIIIIILLLLIILGVIIFFTIYKKQRNTEI